MARTTAVLLTTGVAATWMFLAYQWWAWRSARAGGSARASLEEQHTDPVDLASDQSFPASDPPGWTGTIAS